MRVENALEINAPVSRVWELTVDVESWPQVTPTMTDVAVLDDGPLRVGSEVRIKQPGQMARIWTVTHLEPEQRFAWSSSMLGSTMTASHLLIGTPTGSLNTLIVEIERGWSRVLGAVLRRPIEKAIAKENQGFKRAAEEQKPTGA